MIKIGEFSKISGLSIDTLYHYEKKGILMPNYTDYDNGYRYYDFEQLVIVNKILALKDAKFSLSEIRNLMNSNLTTNEFLELIEEKANIIENSITNDILKLNRLRNNIFLIKNGGAPQMNEIMVKRVEPIVVASLRKQFHNSKFDKELEEMWRNLKNYINENKIKIITPCMMIYHTDWWSMDESKNLDVEVIEPVINKLSENKNVYINELPAIESMVSIVHKGSFDKIGETFDNLFEWIEKNDYKKSGPIREIYHKGEWVTKNTDEYITELQIPVEVI
jgi:effector-binding domain-containing protein